MLEIFKSTQNLTVVILRTYTTYKRNLTNNFCSAGPLFLLEKYLCRTFFLGSFFWWSMQCLLSVWIFDGQRNNCFNGKMKISYGKRKQRNFVFTRSNTPFFQIPKNEIRDCHKIFCINQASDLSKILKSMKLVKKQTFRMHDTKKLF